CALLTSAAATAVDLTRGAQIYNMYCAQCHAPGGNPGPDPISLGAGEPFSILIAFRTIVEMQEYKFEELLSQSDIDNLAAYLAVLFDVAPPPQPPVVTAVEYYHSAFDHYFVTTISDEITKLDNGTFVGWTRTGRQFNAYASSGDGLRTVCRFFS